MHFFRRDEGGRPLSLVAAAASMPFAGLPRAQFGSAMSAMSLDSSAAQPPARRLACARCGTTFDCGLGGDCWCAALPYRVPLTDAGRGEDCLCPNCLRKAAE